MVQLVKETKNFKVTSEKEATELIEQFKQDQYNNNYKLIDSRSKYQNKKLKGEIIEEWYLVTIVLDYE